MHGEEAREEIRARVHNIISRELDKYPEEEIPHQKVFKSIDQHIDCLSKERCKRELTEKRPGEMTEDRFLNLIGLEETGLEEADDGLKILGKKVLDSENNLITGHATLGHVNFPNEVRLDVSDGENIKNKIENAAADNTTIIIPEGSYRIPERIVFSTNTAVVGSGEVYIKASGSSEIFVWADVEKAGLKNIIFDQREEYATLGNIMRADNFHVENVEFLGRGSSKDHEEASANVEKPQYGNEPNCFATHVSSEDGLGVYKNVVARKGSHWAPYDASAKMFVHAGPANVGTIRCENCQIEEFPNNGIYAGASTGPIEIIGGEWWNNISGIRAGGEGVLIKGVTCGTDGERYSGSNKWDGIRQQLRPIKIEMKKGALERPGRAKIEDCDIIIQNLDSGRILRAVQVRKFSAGLEVKNTRIKIDHDIPGIHAETAESGAHPLADGPKDIQIDGLQVTGTSNQPAVKVGDNRNGSKITNSCIGTPGRPALEGIQKGSNVTIGGNCTPPTASSNQTNYDQSSETSSQTTTTLKDGEIEKIDDDPKSAVFGSTATGVLENDTDRYRIKGRINEFHVEEPVTIRVDGEEMSGQEFIQRFVKCVPKAVSGSGSSRPTGNTGGSPSQDGEFSGYDKEGNLEVEGLTIRSESTDDDGNILFEHEFQRKVSITELGVTEGDNIDSAIENVEPGTIITIPPGRYKSRGASYNEEIAIIGEDPNNRPVIEPLDPNINETYSQFKLRYGGPYVVGNIEFDYVTSNRGGKVHMEPEPGNDTLISNIEMKGQPLGNAVSSAAYGDNDTAVVEYFKARDGDEDSSILGTAGLLGQSKHTGQLWVVNSHFWHFGQGLYLSGTGFNGDPEVYGNGECHVRGGTYKNNNVAGVRLGSTNSTVKNVLFEQRDDLTAPTDGITWKHPLYDKNHPERVSDDFGYPYLWNFSGVWLKNRSGMVVENCRFNMDAEDRPASGAIRIAGSCGDFTVRNCDVSMNFPGGHAVSIGENGGPGTIEQLRVKGDKCKSPAFNLQNSDDVTITDSCVHLTGSNIDGIEAIGTEATITNTNINVTGQTFDERSGGSIQSSGITTNENCEFEINTEPSSSDESQNTSNYSDTTLEDIRNEFSFSREVNAVEDLGLDNTGNTPIDEQLNDLQEGTLVVFPEGEYSIGNRIDLEGKSNIGLVGAEGAKTVIKPGAPRSSYPGDPINLQLRGANIALGGFTRDVSGDGYGGEWTIDASGGDIMLFDIEQVGQTGGETDSYWLTATENDKITVKNVNMRDGAKPGYSASGFQVRYQHAGEIHFINCDVWHFPSKGIYASAPAEGGGGGSIHVDGGIWKNNNDCDFRLGTEGSTIKNVKSIKENTTKGGTVTWNNPIPRRSWETDDGTQNNIITTRSIRLKGGSTDGDVLIENCEFQHEIGKGPAVIMDQGSYTGTATIRNCKIHVNNLDIDPIRVDGSEPMIIEKTSITGNTQNSYAIRSESSQTEIRNCCIGNKYTTVLNGTAAVKDWTRGNC